MSKLSYAGIVVVLMLGGSFLWNGCQTPRQTDAEYLRQYKVLNATNMSDAEILKERAEKDTETAKWKHTNKLLDDELESRGLDKNEFKMQRGMDQVMFHHAYYDKNVSAKRFVDYMVKRGTSK